MENRNLSSGAPPRMMNAIIAGFNVVANNLLLLVLPVLIDLFLWLGPQVSIRQALKPIIDDIVRLLQQINSPQVASQMNMISDVWNQILVKFNLLGTIRTLPIGVPSLMSSALTESTPLGPATIFEVPTVAISLRHLAGGDIGGLCGWMPLFLDDSAGHSGRPGKFEFKFFLKKFLYAFALTMSLVVGLLVITIPALMLISVMALISPGLGDFAMLARRLSVDLDASAAGIHPARNFFRQIWTGGFRDDQCPIGAQLPAWHRNLFDRRTGHLAGDGCALARPTLQFMDDADRHPWSCFHPDRLFLLPVLFISAVACAGWQKIHCQSARRKLKPDQQPEHPAPHNLV